MSRSAPGGVPPTLVFTWAEVLFSSFDSMIVLSGSTTAVFVIVAAVGGAIALIVIVPFWPAFTAPPLQVTVIGVPLDPQLKRLVVLNGNEGRVTPLGSVSTTLMFEAFALPMLLTVSV